MLGLRKVSTLPLQDVQNFGDTLITSVTVGHNFGRRVVQAPVAPSSIRLR